MAEVLRPFLPANTPSLSSPQSQSPLSPPNDKIAIMSNSQQSPNKSSRILSTPRNHFNSTSSNSGYRGTAAPAPTYAFKATPHLRASSASGMPQQPHLSESTSSANRQRYPAANASVSTTSSSSSSSAPSWSQNLFAKDDSVLNTSFSVAPFTTTSATSLSSQPSSPDHAAKPSPNRYHRPGHRSDSNTSTVKPVDAGNLVDPAASHPQKMGEFSHPTSAGVVAHSQSDEAAIADSPAPANGHAVADSIDFPSLPSAASANASSLKRYKRRSNSGISPNASPSTEAPPPLSSAQATRPTSSQSNGRSSFAGNRSDMVPSGPARTFADVAKRTNASSPLARPPVQPTSPPSPDAPRSFGANSAFQNSPAVAAMAALTEKDSQRGVKSKLRRAFSFGSTAELRRAGEGPDAALERAKLRQQQFSNELDEEQEAIAKQQTEAGLGNNIYSGQAGFTGSTDNLSISSTASSASLMLRKMGRGVKKGGRSIKGLFRPKSVIGVPPADGPAVGGQVTFVTVEAEREKVNVNADPKDQPSGGTGFPRLERNSVDAAVKASASIDEGADTRKSILGGEQDRMEVLSAVRRGILKRSTTEPTSSSPSVANSELTLVNPSFGTPERRGSPAPSNSSTEPRAQSGHRRTDSVALEGGDYFATVLPRHLNGSNRSLPGTSKASSRNISFSPRIQFYDVWSPNEYDRRGDIATCNRLTPMLAQQIKEELNTFKMEMEVHEASKPHTHFF